MKKRLNKKLVSFFGAFVLLFMFLSCTSQPQELLSMEENKRADAFFDIIYADPAEDYVVEMNMNMNGSLYGMEVEIEAQNETTYIGYHGSSPVLHSEAISVVTFGLNEEKSENKTKTVSGFRDGKIYESREHEGMVVSLVSNISADEYKAHQEYLVGFSDEEIAILHKSATVKSCVRDVDGNWNASFYGYPTSSINSLIDYCFDQTVWLFDGYKVKDIIFMVVADKDFRPTNWEYRIVFESSDNEELYIQPEAKTEITFENIGTATAPKIDFWQYTEVEGLADLQKIRHYLNEMLYSDSGSFTSERKISTNTSTQIHVSSEKDCVVYNTENEEYTFDIIANLFTNSDSISTDFYLSYINGIFITSQSNGVNIQQQDMSEANAKSFIYSLIDPAELSNALVSNVMINDSNYTHSFIIENPDHATIEALLAGAEGENLDVESKVSVVYEETILKKYNYVLILKYTVQGQSVTVMLESTVTIDYVIT